MLIVSGLLGAVVYGIEILSPSMFAELLGTEDGTAFFGVLAAAEVPQPWARWAAPQSVAGPGLQPGEARSSSHAWQRAL